jgi:heme O synthase-like polyprenyltransferase
MKGIMYTIEYLEAMFENRTKKQRMIIYIILAVIVSLLLSFMHIIQGWILSYVIVAAIIEFLCIFYILYLPLKIKN